MSALQKKAWDYSNSMVAVGYALKTIADLLGADGSEHYITDSQQDGLLHAVHALGELVLDRAGDLSEHADPDEGVFLAPQNATQPVRGATGAGENQ